MKQLLSFIFSLGMVCLVGSAALAWVNQTTAEPIRKAQQRALESSLKLVLPAETATTEAMPATTNTAGDVHFFRALDKDGRLVAYAAQATSTVSGFKGPVKVVVGLEKDGKVRAVMVTEHTETPGLGTNATDRSAVKSLWDVLAGKAKDDPFPPNEFLDSFAGMQASKGFEMDKGDPKNAVAHVSGATYSSRSVISAVDAIGEAFRQLKDAQ